MFFRNKYKIFLFLILIFVFIYLLSISFSKSDKIEFSNQILKDDLVLDVFVNDNLCAYDVKTDTYFFSYDSFNNEFEFTFNSLYELDYIVVDDSSYEYYIYAYNKDFYDEVKVVFTKLPIVDVKDLDISGIVSRDMYNIFNYEDSFIYQTNYKDIPINSLVTHFIDPELGDNYVSNSLMTIRGSSSIWFNKKGYKLSFDEKVSVFDLPNDDKYVLDALYVDKSKIRNMLSGDLWNLINNNQNINNDLKGVFVELFYDNEYLGLYVLKEKVDKSVTNIGNNGTILKAIFHINQEYIDKLKMKDINIVDNIFLNYEIKNYNEITTKNIISKMSDYYINNESFEAIEDNFILDNYFNYKIFVSLINGGDNVSYNQYYSLVDDYSNILITPWDMDLTFGLNWNDFTRFRGVFSMETSYDSLWMDTYITNNMDSSSLNYLKNRYWELRKDVITMNTINNYLDNYKKILVDSGAAKRDSLKWYRYDIEEEIELIRTWCYNRIQFLDQYFKL